LVDASNQFIKDAPNMSAYQWRNATRQLAFAIFGTKGITAGKNISKVGNLTAKGGSNLWKVDALRQGGYIKQTGIVYLKKARGCPAKDSLFFALKKPATINFLKYIAGVFSNSREYLIYNREQVTNKWNFAFFSKQDR
jgi:hypothetical protein